MVQINLNFTDTGGDQQVSRLNTIVTQSQQAQRNVEGLADSLGVSANGAKKLIDEFLRLQQQGASNDQIFRTLNNRLGITEDQFKDLQKAANDSRGSLKNVGDEAQTSGRRLGVLRDVLRGIAQGVGQAAFQSILNVISSLRQEIDGSIDAAAEYERVIFALEGSLERLGGSAGVSVEGLQAFASDLGDATLTSEEAVLRAARVLTSFTNIVGSRFERTIVIAQDLAETIGGDLEQQIISLGKAVNDPVKGVTALADAGIQFTDSQRELIKSLVESGRLLEAQDVILNELQVQYGGTGEAAAQGLAGALDTLGEEANDLRRIFGEQLQESLTDLTNLITENIQSFEDLSQAAGDAAAGGLLALLSTLEALGQLSAPFVREVDIEGLGVVRLSEELRQARDAFIEAGGAAEEFDDRIGIALRDFQDLRQNLLPGGILTFSDEDQLAALRQITPLLDQITAARQEQASAEQSLDEQRKRAAEEALDQAKRQEAAERNAAEQREDSAASAAQATEAALEASRSAVEELTNLEEELGVEAVEKVRDARIKAIEDTEKANLDRIDKEASAEEAAINERFDAEIAAVRRRIEIERTAEKEALEQRSETDRLLANELDKRNANTAEELAAVEAAIAEEARLREGLAAIDPGELLNRDALDIAQDLLGAGPDLSLLSDEQLQQLRTLLPQIQQAQQELLNTTVEPADTTAQEAQIEEERQEALAKAEEEADKERQEAEAQAVAEANTAKAETASQIIELENAAADQRNLAAIATAEEISRLQIDTAQRVAALQAANLAALTGGGIVPRFRGGPVSPGQTYLGGEQGLELIQRGSRFTPIGANGPELFKVRQPGTVLPTPKVMQMLNQHQIPPIAAIGGPQSIDMSGVERRLDQLTRRVEGLSTESTSRTMAKGVKRLSQASMTPLERQIDNQRDQIRRKRRGY